MTQTITPEAFMATAAEPVGGNNPWSARYAAELRRVVLDHAARAPRTVQQHLGPSELGAVCDRQVAGKMAGLPATNHVADPWPSIVGTAVHAWLADAFTAANTRNGMLRWIAENKVTPHPDHPGTADLYDALERAVVDHKALGPSSLNKIRSGNPPRHYVVQLLLYGLGYFKLGLPVRRVALAAYPRTASSLDGLYVWSQDFSDDSGQILGDVVDLLGEVFDQTRWRKEYAAELIAGHAELLDVPATPTDDGCYFCPFYRPQSAKDQGRGCPGGVASHPSSPPGTH